MVCCQTEGETLASIIIPHCKSCRHWVRGYEPTGIMHKRGWPVSNSSPHGWCLLEVPPAAHPAITGWWQECKNAGIETKETSSCDSHEIDVNEGSD